VPHDLHEPRGPGHPHEIARATANPAPGRDVPALEHSGPGHGRQIEQHAAGDRKKRAQGHAVGAEIRQAPQPQSQAETPDGIDDRGQPPGEKRHHHQPFRPKKRVGDDEKGLDGQQPQKDSEEIQGSGAHGGGDLQQGKKKIPAGQSGQQDDHRGPHPQQQAQPDVAVGPQSPAASFGLAYRGHRAAGHGRGQNLEEKHGLGEHPDHGLGFRIDAAPHVDIGEPDDHVEEHHENLGPGQEPDGAIVGLVGRGGRDVSHGVLHTPAKR